MEKQVKTYKNGLRLIFEKNEKNVIALNMNFNVGSQNEKKDEEGYSHFIEHLTFKSTTNYTTEEIMDKLTFYGADYNAYTSKTTTKYVFRCLSENFEKCFELYADMLLNSKFDEEEISKEREVVIEEMKRCDDDPVEVMYRRAMENYFDGLSFAHDVLGSEEVLNKATKESLLAYKNRFYKPENCVISVAGNASFEEIDRIIEKYYASKFDYEAESIKIKNKPFAINIKNKYDIIVRDDNQANVCIHIKSVTSFDEDKYIADLYTSILGNTQNSRLFKTIRERLGLVYTIGAYNEIGANSGEVMIIFGTRPKNIQKAIKEIKKIILELAENGVTYEELQRAINWKKSCLAFGMETNTELAEINGTILNYYNKIFDVEERKQKTESVTTAQINEFAKRIASETVYNVVAVGKNINKEDLKQF